MSQNITSYPEWSIWRGIKSRCEVPSSSNYKHYGGKGVKLHPAWRKDFRAFLAAVGSRPSKKHSLDRIDNAQGYVPGNVRWATRSQQLRNTSVNRRITAMGRTGCIADWAEWMKLPYQRIYMRLYRGATPEEALGLA